MAVRKHFVAQSITLLTAVAWVLTLAAASMPAAWASEHKIAAHAHDLTGRPIVVIGSGNIGKTSLVRRLSGREFVTHHPTTFGVAARSGQIGQSKVLYIDLAGQTADAIAQIPLLRTNGGKTRPNAGAIAT